VASITALVDPALLVWAREKANYEPKAAARKMGLPDERVSEWEAGTRKPTIADLRKAAKAYGRPLGVFFLPEPPQGFETLRDFRRVYGSPAAEWSPALHEEYRRAHAQRDALLEIAELDEISVPTAWRLTAPPDVNDTIATRARASLRHIAPIDEPTSGADEFKHLNYWIAALEHAGVLVLHTTGGKVPKSEMRAFSLYFDEVPVIMLNGKDWPRGRLFSLIHEYAHLLLHTGRAVRHEDRHASGYRGPATGS
jgi:transcriptional regulator with XRE-family HTH domain